MIPDARPASRAKRASDPTVPVSRRYEPTIATPVYAAVSLFLAIGAVNSQNNLLFWAFGVSVAIMVISGLISGPALYNLRVRREAPTKARAGETSTVRYTLWSRSRRSRAFALVIEEVPEDGVTAPDRVGVPTVAPSPPTRVSVDWKPDRRAVVTLKRFEVRSTFPFGLLRKVLVFEQPVSVRVGPAAISLRSDAGPASVPASHATSAVARRVGLGDQIHALREYASGDSLRQVAWRASARGEDLLVRQHTDAMAPTFDIFLEPPSTETPSHLWERAIAMTCAAAERAIENGRRVAVHFPLAHAMTVRVDGRPGISTLLNAAAELPSVVDAPRAHDHGAILARAIAANALVISATGRSSDDPDALPIVTADRAESWLARGVALHPSLLPEPTQGRRGLRARWRGPTAAEQSAPQTSAAVPVGATP